MPLYRPLPWVALWRGGRGWVKDDGRSGSPAFRWRLADQGRSGKSQPPVLTLSHIGRMKLQRGPAVGTAFEDGDPPAAKPVLMADILVRRDQNVEPRALGRSEEIAVAQFMPTHLKGVPDFGAGENRPRTARDAVIEKGSQV